MRRTNRNIPLHSYGEEQSGCLYLLPALISACWNLTMTTNTTAISRRGAKTIPGRWYDGLQSVNTLDNGIGQMRHRVVSRAQAKAYPIKSPASGLLNEASIEAFVKFPNYVTTRSTEKRCLTRGLLYLLGQSSTRGTSPIVTGRRVRLDDLHTDMLSIDFSSAALFQRRAMANP